MRFFPDEQGLILVPITRWGKPGMFLEVATKEGLIREVHAVGDLLDVEPAVLELMLDLRDRMAVDDRLGALSPYGEGDVGEVAWSDVECLGIEGHLSLRGAIAQYQL